MAQDFFDFGPPPTANFQVHSIVKGALYQEKEKCLDVIVKGVQLTLSLGRKAFITRKVEPHRGYATRTTIAHKLNVSCSECGRI
ncbi:uncharacterized protein [Henckelia pumila]|uniref:uncharacterized protein isoform X2 n=1 Tax=Henckelia pumila TaxID=405737 RepID=UPI003C6E0EEE